MSTLSLRQDHHLIEKVLRAMEVTTSLLEKGSTIPQSALMQVIDFTKNFTLVCHHGKEEQCLFPELEKKGMPHDTGPIAVMLMEHRITRKLANCLEESAKNYIKSGEATQLIFDIMQYISHVERHIWKENNRLFIMCDTALDDKTEKVNDDLRKIEEFKLGEIGKTRVYYEKVVEELERTIINHN